MTRWLLVSLILLGFHQPAFGDDPKVRPITAEERDHWAFRTPVRPAPPAVQETAWVKNPIDTFILSALEEFKLHPSPEAERSALLRRLSFDLTGLPPRPEELDAFLNDTRPNAYERQVERMLASPAFGERQAQHWLDLARYADTDGFEFDQARPNAWRYRDWVVSAINADMPYDQFIKAQLAGDEVSPESPAAFIATGFNRCYPDMVDLNDQSLRRQNALNDITDTTGLVFMGLTIGCARCHDHKTDPIRQVDYYRLQAIFTPARFRDDYPIATPSARREYERQVLHWHRRVAAIQSALLSIEMPIRNALTPNPAGAVPDDVISAMQKRPAERSHEEVRLVYDLWARDRRIKPRIWMGVLGVSAYLTREILLKGLERELASVPSPLPLARGLDESSTKQAQTYLLIRGEHTRKGPIVEAGVPGVLSNERFQIERKPASSGRRAALANWLVDPGHPLTARVAVNRIWQLHFGRGLVPTPSDFGKTGVEPSNPELLDWLATELIGRAWSIKELHRQIVTSATYRQASLDREDARTIDPENQLLWRQNRRRLDGEAIRDAILSTSNQLNRGLGGPPVFPELPAELTRLSSKGEVWPVSRSSEDRNRRSLYVFVRRNLRYPFFEVFDRPDTNASCAMRPISTIAPQALTLFNGQFVQDHARTFASRLKPCATDEGKVTLAFKLAFGRPPNEEERTLSLEFLKDKDPERLADFALGLINSNEFIYID